MMLFIHSHTIGRNDTAFYSCEKKNNFLNPSDESFLTFDDEQAVGKNIMLMLL